MNLNRYQRRVVLSDRDRQLLSRIFENRVMSTAQIRDHIFPGIAKQNVSRRLVKLTEYGFIDWRVIRSIRGARLTVYSVTLQGLNAVRERYQLNIAKEYYKSDSVDHDVELVEIRRRMENLSSVKQYLTENMLQACEEFTGDEDRAPFVKNNTDAVMAIMKNGRMTVVGFEFERSEKNVDRYIRKLLSYYAEPKAPVIFYVCRNAEIQKLVARAEASVMGGSAPRCFYALLPDVLGANGRCTFKNLVGDTITIS